MVSVSLADAISFHRNSEKGGKARQRGDCDLEINLKFTKVYTFTFLTFWLLWYLRRWLIVLYRYYLFNND